MSEDYAAPTGQRPTPEAAELAVGARRIGQSADRVGRRLLLGEIDRRLAVELLATAVADLAQLIAREASR